MTDPIKVFLILRWNDFGVLMLVIAISYLGNYIDFTTKADGSAAAILGTGHITVEISFNFRYISNRVFF